MPTGASPSASSSSAGSLNREHFLAVGAHEAGESASAGTAAGVAATFLLRLPIVADAGVSTNKARALLHDLGASNTVRTHGGGGSSAHNKLKARSLVFKKGAAHFTALGERRASAFGVFEPKSASADRAVRASAGVSRAGADSAGARTPS